MANYTRKAILQTFEDMLTELPFDKITVSALVTRCGISSNTFYYHIRDIYDLLDVWMDEQRNQYFQETKHIDNWMEQLKIVLHKIQNEPERVQHIFSSLSRERVENYVFNSVETWFYEEVKKHAAAIPNLAEEKVRRIAGFYCYSFLGFFLKFIWEHMKADVDESVDGIYQIFREVWRYLTEPEADEKNIEFREGGAH